MWGIVLSNGDGEPIGRLVVEAPIEAIRDWCRLALESRPEAVQARLESEDGYLDYAYPEVTLAD